MKKIIDYLLDRKLAEIPKKGRKEMTSIQIGNKNTATTRINPYQTVYKRN